MSADDRTRPGPTSELDAMAARVAEMCARREWSMHWTARGAYLHLEASELIEAIRGKHGDPVDEAGDVLLVLMSITESAGIPFHDVIAAASAKLGHLMTAPRYAGEARGLDIPAPAFECEVCQSMGFVREPHQDDAEYEPCGPEEAGAFICPNADFHRDQRFASPQVLRSGAGGTKG